MFANINPSIDVRLLRTTYLLLCERNVSRVSVLLGHSQPAVSACLKRARETFGDPLLVRAGQKMVLTERGEEIKVAIANVLGALSGALNGQEHFDPQLAHQRIRIAAVNCFGAFLVPAIGARLRREAPHVSVDFFAPAENCDLVEEMGSGRVDAVIGNWPSPQQSLKSTALFRCDIACVTHQSHPLCNATPMTMATYLEADHVSPTPGSSAAFSPIDGRLTQLGLRRHIAMSVPEYALIPAILQETDLVFTTARPYAEHIVATSADGQLRLLDAPPEFDQMNLYLLWHERAQASAANKWLRSVIRSVAKQFDQVLHASVPISGAQGTINRLPI